MNPQHLRETDSMLGVLTAFFRWKRPILISTMAALLGTGLIAFLLPNYYQSNTIFVAASPDQFKPEMIFGTTNQDMKFFGETEDIDRLLSIGRSNELMWFMIDSFNLYEKYRIAPNSKMARFKVQKAFKKHFNIQKNKFDAIELTIEDRDPELAMYMAETARKRIDDIASQLIKNSQGTLIETFRRSMIEKDLKLTGISDSMRWLRENYGIADPREQGRILAELLTQAEAGLSRERARLQEYQKSKDAPVDTLLNIKARISGFDSEINRMRNGGGTIDMRRFNLGRDRLIMYQDIQRTQSEKLGEDRERLSNLESVYHSPISAVYIIEEAEVPARKSRPVRSLIILAAGFITFVTATTIALLLDRYRDIDWRRVWRGEEVV
jgi:uncharacterized protein involved in exopolysaccharide biosynthesis